VSRLEGELVAIEVITLVHRVTDDQLVARHAGRVLVGSAAAGNRRRPGARQGERSEEGNREGEPAANVSRNWVIVRGPGRGGDPRKIGMMPSTTGSATASGTS